MSKKNASGTIVAKRYASAAFALAVEAKNEAQLVEEMAVLAAAIENNAELKAALANPLIRRETKAGILEGLCQKASALTRKTLEIIAHGGRVNDIPAIARQLALLQTAARGELVAEITSARELTAAAQTKLATSLEAATGKKLKLQFSIDPRLIGGVVIQLGSLQLDASLSGALNTMRSQLLAHTA